MQNAYKDNNKKNNETGKGKQFNLFKLLAFILFFYFHHARFVLEIQQVSNVFSKRLIISSLLTSWVRKLKYTSGQKYGYNSKCKK